MKVKIIDENQLTRPNISKKAMHRICDGYEHKLHVLQVEEEKFIQLSIDEKAEIVKLTTLLSNQKRLTYYVGCMTYLVGVLMGAGVTWLMQ